MTCPRESLVLALVSGQLPRDALCDAEEHLAACSMCRQVVAAVMPSTDVSRVQDRPPMSASENGEGPTRIARGSQLGRFLVLGEVGAGAFATVHAAHDPELDRKVAVKVVRPRDGHAERLAAEARAMARLTHPNVVTVYEVGAQGPDLFIAMELVEGATLAVWSVAKDRSTREIVDVFVQAGHGLAAAHDASIVHRDFKPANVLVGEDGRVRVADFGLARADVESAHSGTASGEAIDVTEDDLDPSQSGRIVGTPAYMAPEHLDGHPADELTDQYSFCAALFEMLYERRAYDARTIAALREAQLDGRLTPRPPGHRVPRWLDRIVVRGLEADRDRRWPSMRALLRALESGHARRARRRAVTITAVVGGVSLFALGVGRVRAEAACEEASGRLAEIWTPDARESVRHRIAGIDAPWARLSAERTAEEFDAYADRWTAARLAGCRVSTIDPGRSPELAAKAQACFDDRLAAFEAAVDVLADADPTTASRAVVVAAALPPLHPCDDPAALGPGFADAGAVSASVAEARREIARAYVLHRAGDYDAGLEAARDGAAAATDAARPELVGAAAFIEGTLLFALDQTTEAEARVAEAYRVATRYEDDRLAFEAAVTLANLASHGGNLDSATTWFEAADAIYARLEADDDGRLWAGAQVVRAPVLRDGGDLEGAQRAGREAVEILERVLPGHERTAGAHTALGTALAVGGKLVEATEHLERALEITQTGLGPAHPTMEGRLQNVGAMYQHMRQFDVARDFYERALVIAMAGDSASSAGEGSLRNALAQLHLFAGDFETARAEAMRALAIYEADVALASKVAQVRATLGIIAENEGKLAEAEGHLAEALAASKRVLGESNPGLALYQVNLARIREARGRIPEAEAAYRAALALQERAFGPDGDRVAATSLLLGQLVAADGRTREGRSYLETALRIYAHDPERRGEKANAQIALGEVDLTDGALEDARGRFEAALSDLEVPSDPDSPHRDDLIKATAYDGLAHATVDRERALAHAAAARELYVAAGPVAAERLAELDAWMQRQEEPT